MPVFSGMIDGVYTVQLSFVLHKFVEIVLSVVLPPYNYFLNP